MSIGLPLLGELLGTFILILLGCGVNASNSFKKMFAKNSGGNWVLIAFGWAFGVMCGVLVANAFNSGAHLNPAVTLFVTLSDLSKESVKSNIGTHIGAALLYIVMQFIGAILAASLLVFINWKHVIENDAVVLKSTLSTGPSHPKAHVQNFAYELVGTLVLVGVILAFSKGANAGHSVLMNAEEGIVKVSYGGISHLGPLPVTFLVAAIGMSLGSVTGYAINPARDLGPRLVYFATSKIFPKKINNIVSADFKYGLINAGLAPALSGLIIGGIALTIS